MSPSNAVAAPSLYSQVLNDVRRAIDLADDASGQVASIRGRTFGFGPPSPVDPTSPPTFDGFESEIAFLMDRLIGTLDGLAATASNLNDRL